MRPLSDSSVAKDQETALIGVDWGTSALRAYRLAADGRILESVHRQEGILHVEGGGFAAVLEDTVGSWRRPGLPIVLSGMIGSRQGWIEVPYLTLPVTFDAIAAALFRHPGESSVYIIPGLAFDPEDGAPDVMRGEETQILGSIVKETGEEDGSRRLLVMPGTHSKWTLIDGEQIRWFSTFMTGELFSILSRHSLLGRLMAAEGTALP